MTYLRPICDLTNNLIPYLWPDTPLATKILKLILCSWTKRLKNHTLWGGTYPHSPYKGVPLLPGTGQCCNSFSEKWSKFLRCVVNIFAVQQLENVFPIDNLLIKTVVPEKQLSSQSKYSFTTLFVIKYAKISTGIFSMNLIKTRKRFYSSAALWKTLWKRCFLTWSLYYFLRKYFNVF